MNMKPRKEYIIIFMELPYLYKNKIIPPTQSPISKKISVHNMFNFVPNYKETPHYSDDKLGIY